MRKRGSSVDVVIFGSLLEGGVALSMFACYTGDSFPFAKVDDCGVVFVQRFSSRLGSGSGAAESQPGVTRFVRCEQLFGVVLAVECWVCP